MIVQCQNCETRFHVADARIPAKGARVRCSRCHHRFHITPSSAPSAAPGAASTPKPPQPPQGSAREPVRGVENGREEDQLDNPEFLFDKPDGGVSAPPRPPPPERERATARLSAPAALDPPEPETPQPVAEERIVESGGKTAQEMLDADIPELEHTRYEIGGSLRDGGAESESATTPAAEDEVFEDNAANERDFLSEDAATPRPSPSLASAPPAAPERADIEALVASLGDDEDSSFTDWDPLAAPAAPVDASPLPPLFAAPASKRESVFDQPDLPAAPAGKQRAVSEPPVVDPEAAGSTALILRIAAAFVGLALLGAAGHLLWLQRSDLPPTADAVQAAGWIAADLETFLARDSTGERVLIVRGNLFPEGSAPPPEVAVRLIGAEGESLAESPRTWLERIDDAEIAPERLTPRLASTSGEIAAVGQQVTGFTAVLSNPPPGVRSVEVVLSARALPPAGTTTADAPPESTQSPPTETAAPSSAILPSPSGDADVVPAAPAPEE